MSSIDDEVKRIIQAYEGLQAYERLSFLRHVFKIDPQKYDHATMCESLYRFHDPSAKRDK